MAHFMVIPSQQAYGLPQGYLTRLDAQSSTCPEAISSATSSNHSLISPTTNGGYT